MLSHFLMNGLLPKSSSWSALIHLSLSKSLVELVVASGNDLPG